MHWTYDEERPSPDCDLAQGDILVPTAEFRDALSQAHTHFCHEKYIAFMVASQSCDLVRRKQGRPKTRYISIAAVRSLESVLRSLLEGVAPRVGNGVFRKSSKGRAKDFLSRLVDQNEQAQGLFYLHADPEIGVLVPAVAFLRVSVSLRAEHYATMCSARTGRLTPEFRANLGWLLGNLYSRAASPDWSDFEDGKRKKAELVDEFLYELVASPTWIDDEVLDGAKQAGVPLDELEGTAVDELEQYRPPDPIDSLADEVCNEVSRLGLVQPESAELATLKNRLTNSGKVKKLVKKR